MKIFCLSSLKNNIFRQTNKFFSVNSRLMHQSIVRSFAAPQMHPRALTPGLTPGSNLFRYKMTFENSPKRHHPIPCKPQTYRADSLIISKWGKHSGGSINWNERAFSHIHPVRSIAAIGGGSLLYRHPPRLVTDHYWKTLKRVSNRA